MVNPVDWDRDPDLVIDVLRQSHAAVVERLRAKALIAREHPQITAEHALNDAAAAVEHGLAVMITKLGGQPARPNQ
jgi:hypothetical protein